MSKSIYYIDGAEQRDPERVEKTAEYADNKCIRFTHEIDNNDICYRGINLVDFEKACLVSRIELLKELQSKESEDYEEVISRFVIALEYKLFDGLYMGDLEDLIEESDETECYEGAMIC